MPVLFSCRRASWLRSRVQTRGEEEQVNVEGRSGGRVDKGKTGNRGRLLLVHFVSTGSKKLTRSSKNIQKKNYLKHFWQDLRFYICATGPGEKSSRCKDLKIIYFKKASGTLQLRKKPKVWAVLRILTNKTDKTYKQIKKHAVLLRWCCISAPECPPAQRSSVDAGSGLQTLWSIFSRRRTGQTERAQKRTWSPPPTTSPAARRPGVLWEASTFDRMDETTSQMRSI